MVRWYGIAMDSIQDIKSTECRFLANQRGHVRNVKGPNEAVTFWYTAKGKLLAKDKGTPPCTLKSLEAKFHLQYKEAKAL